MNPLAHPDSQHVQAAKGWLGLLSLDEAARELEKIAEEFRSHPDVLEIRWLLAANAKNWTEALSFAERVCYLAPEKPEGWIYRGTSLVELNRYADAYGALRQGQERFPEDEILAYDLGCVCCALGRLDEAIGWIRKSIEISGADVKRQAVEDPDLEPIRKLVSTLSA
jgi:tetratricopeptide (TPR) repeat protein